MRSLLSYFGSWKRKRSTVNKKSFMKKFLWNPRWSPSDKELLELKKRFDKKRALRRRMLGSADRDEWVRLKQQKDLYLIQNLATDTNYWGFMLAIPTV